MTASSRVHEQTGRLNCACGAKFKTPGKLRAHVALYLPEREGFGYAPRAPEFRQRKKRRAA